MSTAAGRVDAPVRPLTALTDEERMFQSAIRDFARQEVSPFVREMDEAGLFRKDLLKQFFDLGLMAIEIPEEFGGQGGTFFQSVLAVEELAAIDPSAAVIVDVQNTLVNNAVMRWASDEQKRRGLITAEWGTSENNRRARYYRLTTAGRKQLTTETGKWERLTEAIAHILNPDREEA
jgi:butyryl-CoA dehydrogenase/short/branched chain acyl-CoA dehydrogenase